MANAGSTQANYHTIVIVQDDHGSNATSEHFFLSLKWKKKPVENNHYKTLPREEMANKQGNNTWRIDVSDYMYSIATL